jgi:hypothetical protein
MVIGWEALIVLQDLRGLTPGEQAAVSTWAAGALIQAALQDQPETSGQATSRRLRSRQALTRISAVTPRPGRRSVHARVTPRDRPDKKIACRALCTNLWMAVDGLCRTASSLCKIGGKRWIP